MAETRITIETKDIQKLTGKSKDTALRQLRVLRDALQKKDHQAVTIKEYCEYYGLDLAEVKQVLNVK